MNSFRTYRILANMSQAEAAKRIGVSQQAISKWESGKTLPRILQAFKAAEVYGCKVTDLVAVNTVYNNSRSDALEP